MSSKVHLLRNPITVVAVSSNLPPFWPTDPTLWFAQVELQFLNRYVTTQDTGFADVVESLQPDKTQEVRDLLIAPPALEHYTKLKAELIRDTSAS